MTDWKDDHREHKDELGITWGEYHERYFVHTSELDDLQSSIEELNEHVQTVAREYRDLKREIHEVKVLTNSEEYGND